MTTPKRWRSGAYLLTCLAATAVAAPVSWWVTRSQTQQTTLLCWTWGVAWMNAILAAIVNRHAFSKKPLVFMAWSLLGNAARTVLVGIGGAIAWAMTPNPATVVAPLILAAYLLFLSIEIFFLVLFSNQAGRAEGAAPERPA